MAIGLKIYHPQKGLILNITDSLTRILGSFTVDTPTGSRTIDIRDNDRLFVFFVPETAEYTAPMQITTSSNQINWVYRGDFDHVHKQRIYYGTY
nr:MAG TPA: hypothetical protein [Caudoviricetes sp.]